MRITQLILILLISHLSFGQDKYTGIYKDHFSENIELKSDSTFIHNYRFDLTTSWTTGKWKVMNDTIFLTTKLVMDTLEMGKSGNKILKDSLVLSPDKITNRVGFGDYAISSIASGGQNRIKPPKKLFWKNDKLYRINENGTLDSRKVKAHWTNKKYKTYFRKESE